MIDLALILLAAANQLAAGGTRQCATVIMSEDPVSRGFEDRAGYSDGIEGGDFIFLSGVVASLRPGETTYEPAFTRAFDEIAARLRRLGAGWDDVVEMTTFHTDLPSQNAAFVAVKQRYVRPPYPAWTAIGISRLVPPFGVTEIRITALRSRSSMDKGCSHPMQ